MGKKKVEFNYTSKLIKRLLKRHKCVRLEVYSKAQYSRSYNRPYGMRHMYSNGNCTIRYYEFHKGFKGRKRSICCFEDDISVYRNGFGHEIIMRGVDSTLRAMQEHDGKDYKVKYIYAGDWVYTLP